MTGEFTDMCRTYYGQQCLLTKLEKRFARMLADALPYTGQTHISELDAIIACNRAIQKARDEAEDCKAAKQKTANTILKVLAYFEIQPNTKLTCEVPGEFELQLWAEEDNTIHCLKTKEIGRASCRERV